VCEGRDLRKLGVKFDSRKDAKSGMEAIR